MTPGDIGVSAVYAAESLAVTRNYTMNEMIMLTCSKRGTGGVDAWDAGHIMAARSSRPLIARNWTDHGFPGTSWGISLSL